jgi:nitrate/TMAO reductase-like tetraheme cytochrome c subunit
MRNLSRAVAKQIEEGEQTEKPTRPTPSKDQRKRWLRRPRWLRWPNFTVDLSRPKHRRNLFFASVGLGGVAIALLAVGLQALHYVESSEFCGELCHPMESMNVRYERSPHANVECAACHVGPGAAAFVKSKIAGTKELFALATNTYHRPIKSPVHGLRPAREICGECHTPTSFKDNVIKTIVHYDDDEANTPVQSVFILKMGGWRESTGVSEGIHWHSTNPIYYIAADEQRQVILWVGAEQADGSLKEYYARDMLNMAWSSYVEEARAKGEVRLMDCIDCHNRAGHFIPSPEVTVDEAIHVDLIPADLPYIRAKAVEVLTPVYASEAEAYEAIDGLADVYRAGDLGGRQSDLDAALAELKKIYSESHFPDVKLDWRVNPNNARHSPFPGCFRCHDGKHAAVDRAGNEVGIISVKCNLCHTVPIVGRGDDMLVEAPVITGAVPASHSDFRWTIEHRSTTEDERQDCYTCHGQSFCSNAACHNLSHPPDMAFTHADEYRKTGTQVCYTCHQDVLCSRCHPGGIVGSP